MSHHHLYATSVPCDVLGHIQGRMYLCTYTDTYNDTGERERAREREGEKEGEREGGGGGRERERETFDSAAPLNLLKSSVR